MTTFTAFQLPQARQRSTTEPLPHIMWLYICNSIVNCFTTISNKTEKINLFYQLFCKSNLIIFLFINIAMKVFFIGICGVSMSGLAYLLSCNGVEVRGSDINASNKPKCLSDIQVYSQPHFDGVEWADLIVVSSAIKKSAEVDFARALNKNIISRGQLLGYIASKYEKVVAVAGSHGKTTTTAMIFHTLFVNGKNPTLHLGGNLKDVGNIFVGGCEFFVTEACEYCDNFLYLKPYLSVITNIEPEHMDYFKTFKNELASFKKFEENSLFVIKKSQYISKNTRINKEGNISFSLYKNGKKIDRIKMRIGGKYNSDNAIKCIEACLKLGLNFNQIKFGLQSFKGVKKRCEKINTDFPFSVYVDYAHHPKEIFESAKYFNSVCKNKCVAVFQPHTYSRTKEFYNDFIISLAQFDEIICYRTYSARETCEEGLTEYDLYQGLIRLNKTSYHCENEAYLRFLLKKYGREDVVVFLGAGDLSDKFDFKLT